MHHVDIVRWFPDGRAVVLRPGSTLTQSSGRAKAAGPAEPGPPENHGKSWILIKNCYFDPNFVRGLFCNNQSIRMRPGSTPRNLWSPLSASRVRICFIMMQYDRY